MATQSLYQYPGRGNRMDVDSYQVPPLHVGRVRVGVGVRVRGLGG